MSLEVSNNTADRDPLLNDFNVQTKKQLRCGDSVVDLKEKTNDIDLGCPQSGKLRDEKSKESSGEACDRHATDRCSHGHTHRTVLCFPVSISFFAILFTGCLLVYLLHRDQQTSAEVRDLREKVEKLYSHCGRPAEQRSDVNDRGSSENIVASDQKVVDSGVVTEGGLLRRHNEVETNRFDAVDSWNKGDNSWTAVHAHDDDDDDEDEDEAVDDEDEDVADYDENAAHVDEDEVDEQKEAETIPRRVRRSSGPGVGKRRKGRRSNKVCKKINKCIPEVTKQKPNKKCRKIVELIRAADCLKKEKTPTTAPSTSPPFTIKAVHFMSDFWNGQRKEEFGKEMPLKFLYPADWMKDMYKDHSGQPIVSLRNGGYNVTQSGLYLIYSSVMFHDVKPRQSQAVVVNGFKLFKCMDSVDYIDTDLPPGSNQAKYKTCAMTGVTHLKAGDRLEVQNLYANTEIDLTKDATYFGAVLLSPVKI